MYILITGGFDPIHSGHINMFKEAASIGKVVVGINSDNYVVNKKGAVLLPLCERIAVISSLRYVHTIIYDFDDTDGTSCNAIKTFLREFSHENKPMVFANGGDRTESQANTEELKLCNLSGIYRIYGLGGAKSTSSSKLLSNYIESLKK